jgi:hypothetical protein
MALDKEMLKHLRAADPGDYRYAHGWLGECAREDLEKTKAEYNRRYRERHRERIQAFRPIYKQREKAKRLGLEQFPLPVWDEEHGGLEIPFE